MLSYMLPVEEKSPSPRNLNLSLNLNRSSGGSAQQIIDETSKLLASESTDHREINGDHALIKEDSFDSDASSKKIKMGKLTTSKNMPLKRVSFGSSKGSMVETLVFETPTPLPEHAEREFDFVGITTGDTKTTVAASSNPANGLDDSGIELQEELERSKVRVSFFQCSQPQQVSPPENHIGCFFGDNNNSIVTDFSLLDTDGQDKMTATVAQPSYDRQNSTESGWDNPFRPGGDLSREADEIVNMIKGGKPITPTGDLNQTLANGVAHGVENGASVVDGVTKSEVSQLNASQNGTKSPQKSSSNKPSTNGDATNVTQTQVVPGPQSASHVVIEDKKKKKCTCCVIQ
ncbi:J domain-containing protein DDB_G0295729 [Sergentomyia squamirostris]